VTTCPPQPAVPEFSYRDGALQAEGLPLELIAERVGTPFFLYSASAMEAAYRRFTKALEGLKAEVFFAMKANSNQAVIQTFAALGAGADVVSEGELRRTLAAGIPGEKIVFAGVGKTAPVAIRVNPNVDAKTHTKIATGRRADKFGIDLDHARSFYAEAMKLEGIRLEGLAVHIGSQLTEVTPFREAFTRLAAFYRELQGAGVPLTRLDLGGGLGVGYRGEQPDLEAYAAIVREATEGLEAELAFEPGRYLVAAAGLLVTRVVYVKEERGRRFLIVDGAMNDLIRPTLYEAYHEILSVKEPQADWVYGEADLVGPVCESGDYFARDRLLPPAEAGDLLALSHAGAYGAVMSSTYNSRPLVPEVMVKEGEMAVVRGRQDYATMIAQDSLPDWLSKPDQ
jgi:diaminopimelate decarboxylase